MAALGALSLAGCSENELGEAEVPDVEAGAAFAANEEGAKWYSAACWHNCGGQCVNKVLVKDGIVLRQKTDDAYEDTWERPQFRSCPRGRAHQQLVFGPDRIKYPMKRKGWSPENPNGHLRGIDEWERISWDEAIEYVTGELKKAKEAYGNESILYPNALLCEGLLGAVLLRFGGYVDTANAWSQGTYSYRPELYGLLTQCENDRYDLANADYVVLFGHNAAHAAFAAAPYLKHAKEAGAKFMFVGPEYNATAAAFDAQWFPVRQGTDTAFLLGVAHWMIENDVDGSLIDWDYLNRCTVGFDAGHMPSDAFTDEYFRDYVLGAYDGQPKSPEWASEICGTPVDLIAAFAEAMGCGNDVMFFSSGAPARNRGAENLPQLVMTIGAMGGHFGKPGNVFNLMFFGQSTFNGGRAAPMVVNVPYAPFPWMFASFAMGNPVTNVIPGEQMWSAVLEGRYTDSGNTNVYLAEQTEREIDIHVIVSDANNMLQTVQGQAKGIEAFRKVDFVVSLAYWLKTDAKYSDIVLPIATKWEANSFSMYMSWLRDREAAFAYGKVIDPLYEAKTDAEIATLIASGLGVDMSDAFGADETQTWFNVMAGTTVADGADVATHKPLLTITQEDIDSYGVTGAPQEGVITLQEFLDKGIYRYERSEGDAASYVWLADFRNDPEGCPLATTPSGKMEIYSATKSFMMDNGNKLNPDYTPVSPLPKYLPSPEGYVSSFEDWEGKTPGKYPFLVSNNHYLRRAHTDVDNLPWLREAWASPVFISKQDAEAKGVKTGDVVRVFNDNGQVLRPASVSRCVMPGTMILPHGAAVEVDEATGIDLAGSDNYLCSPNRVTCAGSNGFNSTLVDFEKYEGGIELKADCEWEARIPIAE